MNQIIKKSDTAGEAIERVIAQGDLSKLSPEQRVRYYNDVCQSLDLNPLTRPFEYITLSGKLTLYARKDATEQLRVKRGISIKITAREKVDDIYIVTAQATDKTGRVDESIGAVTIAGQKGDALANSVMKCETKAKRRVTLSISGLGFTDESELETIPNAQPQRGSPIKREAESILREMDACTEHDQLLAYYESAEVQDFMRRANDQAGMGVNQYDVVHTYYCDLLARLPEKRTSKRAHIQSTSEYGSNPAPEAPPVSPQEAPVPTAGPTLTDQIMPEYTQEMNTLFSMIDLAETMEELTSASLAIAAKKDQLSKDDRDALTKAFKLRGKTLLAKAA